MKADEYEYEIKQLTKNWKHQTIHAFAEFMHRPVCCLRESTGIAGCV